MHKSRIPTGSLTLGINEGKPCRSENKGDPFLVLDLSGREIQPHVPAYQSTKSVISHGLHHHQGRRVSD